MIVDCFVIKRLSSPCTDPDSATLDSRTGGIEEVRCLGNGDDIEMIILRIAASGSFMRYCPRESEESGGFGGKRKE